MNIVNKFYDVKQIDMSFTKIFLFLLVLSLAIKGLAQSAPGKKPGEADSVRMAIIR